MLEFSLPGGLHVPYISLTFAYCTCSQDRLYIHFLSELSGHVTRIWSSILTLYWLTATLDQVVGGLLV